LVVGHGRDRQPRPRRDRFELGWPGISFSYLHGTSDRTDVGARFDLLYGFENTTHTAFGAGVDVPFRLVVNRSNKVSVALHIDPGLRSTRATARRTS